jgi:hypothetical protein
MQMLYNSRPHTHCAVAAASLPTCLLWAGWTTRYSVSARHPPTHPTGCRPRSSTARLSGGTRTKSPTHPLMPPDSVAALLCQPQSPSIAFAAHASNCPDTVLISLSGNRGRCNSAINITGGCIRFPALPDFLRSSGSGTGSTQVR